MGLDNPSIRPANSSVMGDIRAPAEALHARKLLQSTQLRSFWVRRQANGCIPEACAGIGSAIA